MDQSESVDTCGAAIAVLVAIELSKLAWVLAIHDPITDKISRRRLNSGDTAALIATCEKARSAAAGRSFEAVAVECVFEAGYDGFWLQRRLEHAGIACQVMDPASLKVDRRARRVKTDRIDAESLLRALQAWRRGDRQACNFVRVPTVTEEDARRPHRELNRLRKERVGHVNRIKALLALHGISDYQPLRQDRRLRLAELRTAEGQAIPPQCRAEIDREVARLELALDHIAQVEAALAPTDTAKAGEAAAIVLEKLTCVGRETAVVLSREVFCRDFRDRRSLAAFAGLTPVHIAAAGCSTIRGSARPAIASSAPASSNSLGDGSGSRMEATSPLGSSSGLVAKAGAADA